MKHYLYSHVNSLDVVLLNEFGYPYFGSKEHMIFSNYSKGNPDCVFKCGANLER